MNTEELWATEFGNSYTQRNTDKTAPARLELWKMLLPRGCESILEVGANTGLNLEAIEQLTAAELYACEPNDLARETLRQKGLLPDNNLTRDYADKLNFQDGIADLVFTSGVLIHIPADKLIPSMTEIHRCSRRWIICGEYFAPQEEMIPYRGHDNTLWRRDYGSLFLDNFNDLRCHSCLFAWKRMTGLDNMTFWLFEKGPRKH